ncbi:TVP38/TMEM64 family protein [Breznakiella homolactica]|uniref:TVP38/TMEM64 family membrane protein n=1 Tax=Breznakiella homolactica TaxID=2798577 RepID=A0A7T8B8J6_9SPIR|nr:VTT domain-containing protein [Breznakiella homolactica]QQO07442.1 VTT domain-containing protein [Breznakiella homolactica]
MRIPRKYVITIALALAVIAGLFFFFMFSGIEAEDILSYTPQSLPLAALFFIAIYCLRSVVMVIPMLLLYVSAGIFFPVPWAIAVTYTGLFCEMTIGYCIGRKMGKDRVEALIRDQKKLKKFFNTMKDNGPVPCFVSRILPLAFDIISMFFGASGMPYVQFVLFSLLGVTPGMIPFVITGSSITDPLSKEFLIPLAVSVAVAGGSFLVLRLLQRDKTKTRSP